MPTPFQDPFNYPPPPDPTLPCMLEQLQNAAVARISGYGLFNGTSSKNAQPIPIIVERMQDIQTQIDEAVDSVGICVKILTPTIEWISQAQISSSLDFWAYMGVGVYENVTINQSAAAPWGTHIRCIQAASYILSLLHLYPHGLPVFPVMSEPPMFIGLRPRPLQISSDSEPLVYVVNFKALVSLP